MWRSRAAARCDCCRRLLLLHALLGEFYLDGERGVVHLEDKPL